MAYWLSDAAPSVPVSSTTTVAIIGGASLIVCAIVPELFRLARRSLKGHAGEESVSEGTLTERLDGLRNDLLGQVDTRANANRAIANTARAETRALRKVLETRDELMRAEIQRLRDEMHRHVWGVHGLYGPNGPAQEPDDPERGGNGAA